MTWAHKNKHHAVVTVLLSDIPDSLGNGSSSFAMDDCIISGMIDWAIEAGRMDAIDKLIEIDRFDRRPFLLAATRDGYVSIVDRLCQKGVDPDYREEAWGRSPISQAAEYERLDVIRLLISNKVDLNMQDINGWSSDQDNEGETALMWTGRCGCEEACRILLENGADLNVQAKYGQTALTWAARNGYESTARAIVEHGADPNLREQDHRHALSLAAEPGHESIVRLLLDKTLVGINDRGTNGRTALCWAASNGHLTVVELLLDRGANANIKDTVGQTALNWAAMGNHEAVVSVLLQHRQRK